MFSYVYVALLCRNNASLLKKCRFQRRNYRVPPLPVMKENMLGLCVDMRSIMSLSENFSFPYDSNALYPYLRFPLCRT